MTKPKKWMNISEAVAHVMQVKKCSHDDAIRMLAEENKKGNLPSKSVKEKSPLVRLTPAEATERFDNNPATVAITLKEFRDRGGFTSNEVLGELRSGRLIASATDAIWFIMQKTGEVMPTEIIIRMDHVLKWMTNPETPPHLLAQWRGNTDQRRH